MRVKLIALLQKPYDLLNALEYAHENGLANSDLAAVVIGRHVNAEAAAQLCAEHGIAVRRVPDPDFYATCVSWLHASRKVRGKALLVVKASLLPLAWMWWIFSYLRARFSLRNLSCQKLVFDAWRSKCMYMACIDADEQILVDGGFSTLHYGLCAAYSTGGGRELVRVSLSKQKPLVPGFLRRIFIAKTCPNAAFFTCYLDQLHPGSRYPGSGNRYAWSASTLKRKEADSRVLILGIPLLKHIDTYVAAALDVLRQRGREATPGDIEYRFHPTDRNRSSLDSNYKAMIEKGANERGVHWSYPSYSLEFDFLNGKSIPFAIVCYESSSAAWIRDVLGDAVEVTTLPDR
jgi:hypothetical protein